VNLKDNYTNFIVDVKGSCLLLQSALNLLVLRLLPNGQIVMVQQFGLNSKFSIDIDGAALLRTKIDKKYLRK